MSRAERSKVSDAIGVWLAVLTVACAVPFGGNIAAFWGVQAMLVGLTALVYGGVVAIQRRRRSTVGFSSIWHIAILWAVFCAAAIFQTVQSPAGLLQFTVPASGAVITPGTISLAPGQTALTAMQLAVYGIVFYLAVQLAGRGARSEVMLRVVFWLVVAVAIFGLLLSSTLGS